jgi:hypothetical protein
MRLLREINRLFCCGKEGRDRGSEKALVKARVSNGNFEQANWVQFFRGEPLRGYR